tara:strand:- start:727266 stop:727754 length:489 start_codon:yes stop_codon:yes gene_type:complete
MKAPITTSKKMYEVKITYVRPLLELMPEVKSSQQAESIFRDYIDPEVIDHKEYFWVMLLTNKNDVLSISEIGKGETSGVSVNIKEIFQLALKANASGLIVCHNHPSGNLKPSKLDQKMTQKINTIAAYHSFNLLDHLILTSEGYYSFSDAGAILTPDNTLPF